MFKVLLVLCWFGVACGMSNYGLFLFGLDDLNNIDKSKDDPKPCCLPETWQGFVQTVFGSAEGRGRAKGVMVTTHAFIDGQKKRLAGKVSVANVKGGFTFLGFYNETTGKGFRIYTFKSDNATKCWTHNYEKFEYQKPCLPENSVYTGSMNVGLKSSGIQTNGFSLAVNQGKFRFAADILVTKDGCVPIAFRELGSVGRRSGEDEVDCDKESDNDKQGRLVFSSPDSPFKPKRKCSKKKFALGSVYTDLEATITDDKVFNIPEVCKKNVESYPLNLDEISDEKTREEFENLEVIMEHIII